MTHEMWIAISILAIAIVLFVTEWIRLDIVAFGVVVSLALTGLLSSSEALSGFSNSAVLTIASLFVVGGAVLQTGLASAIGRQIIRVAGHNEIRLIALLMATVAFLSSFMSDTGTVAVLLPAVITLARKANIQPSRLLIPLAFGSLLGGTSTLIGTTPNIIVSDLLRESGYPAFRLFSFTPSGIVLIISGILFMVLIGRHLLPNRKPTIDKEQYATPQDLISLYRLPDDLYHLRVRIGSALVGQTIASANLGELYKITVLQILRSPTNSARSIPDSTTPERQIYMLPNEVSKIIANDILVAQGHIDDVGHAAAELNLGVRPASPSDETSLINDEIGIAEVLLPPRSSLIGKSLSELRFGSTYALTVIGINRPAVIGKISVKNTRLDFGDTLLVQGAWKSIMALKRKRNDFIVIGEPENMYTSIKRGKAVAASLVLFSMILLLITNLLPVVIVSMLAALAMVLTGCLTIDEAYQSIDWKSLLLVAGMLPMSIALEKAGLVQMVAEILTSNLGKIGPLAVLAGLFLITSVFTQVLSNTATSVLIAPIALASADALGLAPQAYMMAVAIAASTAFASPVASPTNTLVMGAGDYRFLDYVKSGALMIIIALIVSTLILPLLWPF